MTLLDQILDVADTLTEPRFNREPIAYWDNNRHRKIRHHTTMQPGLLAQLYQSVLPTWSSSDEAGGSSVPASRPPLAVEALSLHDEISMAVLDHCSEHGLAVRNNVESNLRGLVGAVGHLDHDEAKQLLADMRHWRGWCNVYLGWERILLPRGVRCPLPDCGQLNSLRVNLTNATALCRDCKATWGQDDGSIDLLAAHIKTLRRQLGGVS